MIDLNQPKFTFLCQPLHHYTFSANGIKQWVETQCRDKTVLNLFGGPTRLNNCIETSNDLNKDFNTTYHLDALECVKMLITLNKKYKVILLDPPYSYRKSMELYNGNRNSRFKLICDLLPKLLEKDGKVITFGYHSIVMGKSRGFILTEICLISHGGAMRTTLASVEEIDKLDGDTIISVEKKRTFF